MSCRRLIVLASLVVLPAVARAQQPTATVERIRFQDADASGVVSPQLMLQGRVAGVEVIDDPTPGGGVTVRIRGASSVVNAEPLYVVDGMPLTFGGGISAGSNPLDFVDVNDVESITVVKGAQAMAEYGVRGGNGVVLIETKRGGGESGLRYTGSLAGAAAANDTDMMSADAFRAFVASFDAANGTDVAGTLGSARTDWNEEIRRTGFGHDHAISWAGVSGDATYRASVGYLNRQGAIRGSETTRGNLGLAFGHHLLDDRLRLAASLHLARFDDEFLAPTVLPLANAMTPTERVRDEGSMYGGYFEWDGLFAPSNPVAVLELSRDEGTTTRRMGTAAIELDVIESLTAAVRYGHDATDLERDASQPAFLRDQALYPAPGFASRLDGDMTNTLLEATLAHRGSLAGHGLDISAGWSRERSDAGARYESEQGDPPSSGSGFTITQEAELSSLFARASLDLHDRYFLSLGVRRDAGEEESFTYPSAGVAWRLSSEPFLDGIAALSDLVLRASWGHSSTLAIGSFLTPSMYDFSSRLSSIQFGGGTGVFGVDPELEPERVSALDVALDWGFSDNRYTGTIEYYARTTENLLYMVGTGFGTVLTNIGTLDNRGLELTLAADVIAGEAGAFSWTASFNAAWQQNEIADLDAGSILAGPVPGSFDNIQIVQEGAPVDAFFVLRSRSDNPEFVDMDADGDVDDADLYEDLDANGVIDFEDRRAVGSARPDWILGLGSQMAWHAMDLEFALSAHLGQQVYNGIAASRGNLGLLGATDAPFNLHESVLETAFVQPQTSSDYYVEDASFLRLERVTLGYTLPLVGGARVRVFGTLHDGLTLTGYRGVDPMAGPHGIERESYPRARVFLAGATVAF